MRQLSAEAILLDVVDLHERDRIVEFLTAELGTKRGVARGARTKFGRFGGRLQPLALVRIDWFERDDRELVRIRDVSLVRSAEGLRGDLERLLIGSYLADHAGVFAPENESSPRLFRLLDTCVRVLEEGTLPALVARYFEVWALRLAGVFPALDVCGACGRGLDAEEGAWLVEDELWCRACSGANRRLATIGHDPVRVGAGGRALVAQIQRRGPGSIDLGGGGDGDLIEIERLCAAIRRQFVGDELKSYLVLKRTLAGAQGRS